MTGTALHRAGHTGNGAACDLLLAAGADPSVRDQRGRTPADHASAAGHRSLTRRLDPDPPTAPPPPPGAVDGDVDLPRGSVVGFVYEIIGIVTAFAIFWGFAAQLRNGWSVPLVAAPVALFWGHRHALWAGGPLGLRDGALRLLTLRGVVSVPLDEVGGIIVAPAYTTPDEAERFAALAERYQVLVLGRGPSTQVVLAALRPGLDRADVVENRWWQELERYSADDVMTSRRHRP